MPIITRPDLCEVCARATTMVANTKDDCHEPT
jgi:hypothetical protein